MTMCVDVRGDASSACQLGRVKNFKKISRHGTHWHALLLSSCA